MKQKNSSSSLVTKGYFKKELKQELNSTIDRLLQGIRREITFAIETVTEKLEKRFQEISDKSLTKLDGIAKELEQVREDRIIGDHQAEQIKEKVEDHEKRIGKLEHTQQTT